MERRNFTRQPLTLPATLVRPGTEVVEASIRDFCPGGLFLALAQGSSSSVSAPVDTDEAVQVKFSANLDDGEQSFTVRARVAGVFKGGIGCEFFDPDPAAVSALGAEAARQDRGDTTAVTPVPTTPLAADAQRIVDRLRQRLGTYLQTQAAALFKSAEEKLFLSARDAENNVQQNAFFDSMKDVELLKQPVDNHFVAVLIAHMDKLGAPMDSMQEPETEGSGSELSLVESGEFADWLAAKNIYTRAEPAHRDALFKLDRRLSELANARVEEDNNPVGLAAICHTFHDAVQTVTTPRLARRVVFEAFDDTVIKELESFYLELNELLEAEGVLPGLERPKPSVPTSESDGESDTATEQPAAPAAPQSESAPEPVQPDFDPTTAAAPTVTPAPAPAQAPATAAPVTGTAASSLPATAVTPAQVATVQTPGTAGGAQMNVPVQPAVAPPASTMSGAVETEGELAPHPSLVGGVPFDPAQVSVGNVYSSPMDVTLSAFSTAQTLLGLGRQLTTTEDGAAAQPAYDEDQVRNAIALLQQQEGEAPPAPAGGPDLRTRLTRALRSRHGYADKKIIGETQGNAIDMIEQLVSSIVEDPLVTTQVKPHIQRLEVPLLNAAMRDEAFFSAPEHPARQVLNQLGRITGDKDGQLESTVSRAVDSAVQHVVSDTREDFGAFSEAAQQLDQVVTRLDAARRSNVEAVIKSCEENQEMIRARGSAPAPADDKNLPPEWRQWLDRAKRLQVGDTVVLDRHTDREQRAALAWVGDGQGTFVFVDEQGDKKATVSLQELAMQLRQGTADVVSETELTAMDRGLYGMLRKMHDQVLHKGAERDSEEVVGRRELESQLDALVGRARQDGSTHVLYSIDLDDFDTVRQTCGPKASARLLVEIGRRLLKRLRPSGTVAKLEDEKYAVLLPDIASDLGFEAAERHRTTIHKFKVTWKGERLQLGASIGLATVTADTDIAGTVLTAVSQAQAKAKSAGGNRIEVFRVDDTQASDDATEWRARIDKALENDRLELRCQKISPIGDDSTKSHYEILLGLKGEDGTVTLPGEFIQAAELYGRAQAVDRWVIEHAFKWMADNKRRLLRLGGLSINVSAQSLSDEQILPFVLEQFTRTRLPPGKVLFEITEHAAIQSLSNAENFVRVLKEYGCRFLLDDFGTGHSSYSYLKHLPLDYVKIDGMFIKDIVDNANDQAMVKSINEIGHFMGKKTVAECVESNRILEQLREIGIDYAQGYAIERPRMLSELA